MYQFEDELTFEDIDIKTIFQPFEQSLDIIKELIGGDFDADAKISQDLAITQHTLIRKKSHEKKDFTVDNFKADTIVGKNIAVAQVTSVNVKSHEKNYYNSSGSQPDVNKVFSLKPGTLAILARASEKSGIDKKWPLPVYSTKRCMKQKSHFFPETTTVYKAKCAPEVSLEKYHNCSKPVPVEQNSAPNEPHKPMNILCNSADKELFCNSSSSAKKRKNRTGDHSKDIFLRLYQAMEESKRSHNLMNEWDEKIMGLKRSHSKTMSLSSQSRDHLKWAMSECERELSPNNPKEF